MSMQLLAGFAGLVILLMLYRLLRKNSSKAHRHPYQKNVAIFNGDDRAFYWPLKEAVAEDYEIFGKIPASNIVVPKQSLFPEGSSPIDGLYFDFVLCDKRNLAVACVIQLYDKTQSERNSEPDPLQNICEGLSLPWLRFPVKADYSVEEIQERLKQAMTSEPFYLVETDGRKEPRISNLDDLKF